MQQGLGGQSVFKQSITALFALALAMSMAAVVHGEQAGAESRDRQYERRPCPSGDVVHLSDEGAYEYPSDCSMAGVLVRRGGFGAYVPLAGRTIFAAALYPDGGEVLRVETTAEGKVLAEEVIPRSGGAGGGDECSDYTFGADDSKWTEAVEWYYRSKTWPSNSSNVTFSGVVQELVDGYDNFPIVNNVCGFSDTLSMGHLYRGDRDHPTGIDSSANCPEDGDGINMVDFGHLSGSPDDPLAVTCARESSSGTTRIEGDIKFEKWIYEWFEDSPPSGCSWLFSIEAVMTHEAGHVWGLNHVSEDTSPYLTMSTATTECDVSASTLGAGDIDGAEFLGY